MTQPIDRPTVADPALQRFVDGVKDNLDQITGQEGGAQAIKPLPSTASLADVITALNQIIGRLS